MPRMTEHKDFPKRVSLHFQFEPLTHNAVPWRRRNFAKEGGGRGGVVRICGI